MRSQKNILFFLVFVTLAFAGCFRSSDDVRPANTNLNFVNVVPGTSFTININGAGLVSSSTPLNYGNATQMASGAPGLYDIQITPTTATNAWINGTVSLQSGAYSSMYLIPDSASITSNTSTTAYFTIINNVAPVLPDTSVLKYANIRFFHFSPDTLIINVNFIRLIGGIPSILSQDTLHLFQNRSFNDQSITSSFSTFSTIPATNQYYKVIFTNASIYPSPVLYSIPQVHFADNQAYTMYIMGYRGATGANALQTVNFPTQ